MQWDKDRVYGAAVGHAVGDALGAPHEFYRSTRKLAYTGKMEYEPQTPSRWHGWRAGVVGQVTDDTEMARSLLNRLQERGGSYERDAVIRGYQLWSNSKPIGQGKNTAALFRGVTSVAGFEKRRAKLSPSESNGSLMRCWPLALLEESELQTALLQDCDLTNPTPVNRNASQVYLAALRAALQGKSKADIRQAVLAAATCDKVRQTVENALRPLGTLPTPLADCDTQPHEVNSKHKGWVLVALYVTLESFFLHTTYAGLVDDVIQRGGDTDTNAAIAGALAGAYYGFHEMMRHCITRQNWERVQEADTSKGLFPRAACYHPSSLLATLDALLERMVLREQKIEGEPVKKRQKCVE